MEKHASLLQKSFIAGATVVISLADVVDALTAATCLCLFRGIETSKMLRNMKNSFDRS